MPKNNYFLSAAWAALFAGHASAAVHPALASGQLGLYPAADFRLASGQCQDCPTPRQALWYFRDEPIAVPRAAGEPPLVWLGSPDRIDDAMLAPDGSRLGEVPLQLAPKIASNRSWFDARSLAFFRQREVSARGTMNSGVFTARSLWPRDFVLAPSAAAPLKSQDELAGWVQAEHGGARSAYATRTVWQRPGSKGAWAGKPALAVMLNGAQGDDDEAYGGHFAIATGRVGPQGEWSDWLVNNFYNLDSVSEKGIVASMVPMDSYLMDLNSGQQYYRPSYMLVAVLRDARTAAAYQSGIQDVFTHFYKHDFTYKHAAANCAGISIDMLRKLGWQVPQRGPTGRVTAVAAYGYMAASDRSLQSGQKTYDYFTEEQTRLYPAVAFDAIGRDLLALLDGQAGRTLSAYEQQLRDDVEAVVLVRIPQVPSSRAFGSAPVYSIAEYRERVPADRSKWQIVPTPPRPFPAALRDGPAPAEDAPMLPLPVLGTLAGLGAAGTGALWRLRLWLRRRKLSAAPAVRSP